MAMLLVSTCLRFEVELRQPGRIPASALLFSLLWMTRPEAPVYSLYLLWRRWTARNARPWGRFDLRWVTVAACLIVPYEIFGLLYFGALLPNTHVAKVQEIAPGLGGLLVLLDQPLVTQFALAQGQGFLLLLLLGSTGSLLVGRKRLPLALWLVPLCGMIFILYARGDWMPRYRFFVPILPFLCLFLANGIVELLVAARRYRTLFVVAAVATVVGLGGYGWFQLFRGDPVSLGRGKAERGDDGPGLMVRRRSAARPFRRVPPSHRKRSPVSCWPTSRTARRSACGTSAWPATSG